MKHNYNIENLLLSAAGYKGQTFPGVLPISQTTGGYTAEGVAITASPATRQELVRGTRLYKKDALGRWYFMPVFIRHKDLPGDDHTLELENAVIGIDGTKRITKTQLVGRRGSVKEMIGIDDYTITIAALIRSADGSYPEAQITQMKELWNINESVELVSALTDLLFDGDQRIVIKSIKYPTTPGVEDAQAVTITCETDSAVELTLE